ncbi:MAG: efflux RND transporter periplasmic adaptor subunit [Treponema sp.]|nr:efflux RND transporter periplasmic adaptor subunit [Treponema sp.]
MKKNLKTLIIVLVLLIVTAGIVFFLMKGKDKKKGGFGGGWGGFGGFGGGQTYSVKTYEATESVLHDYVMTNGEVECMNSAQVFPSIGGKVVEVKVSLGSKVSKGDVIAKIDPSTAGSYYTLSSVTAPISGSILQAPSKVGNQVAASTIITTIGDIENLQCTAKIPERYVASLKPGLKAEVTLEAYPDVIFTAKVKNVSPVLDAATRTKSVVLVFDTKDERINAGMFARVKLYTLDYAGELVVPEKALVTNNDDRYIFTVNDDETVTKNMVTVGKSVDGMIQVITGIKKGDKVVSEGMLQLFDGAKIRDITNGMPADEKPAFGEGKPGEGFPGNGGR